MTTKIVHWQEIKNNIKHRPIQPGTRYTKPPSMFTKKIILLIICLSQSMTPKILLTQIDANRTIFSVAIYHWFNENSMIIRRLCNVLNSVRFLSKGTEYFGLLLLLFLLLLCVTVVVFISDTAEPKQTNHSGQKPKSRESDSKSDNSKFGWWLWLVKGLCKKT